MCGLTKRTGSLDRNRTCIWSFGNSYTIHCTTRPDSPFYLWRRAGRGHFINPGTFAAKTLMAIASNITPKNFLIANNPDLPNALSINFNDFNTM